jgi:hypothetical protein
VLPADIKPCCELSCILLPSEELEQQRDGPTLKKHRIQQWSLASGCLSILIVSPVMVPFALPTCHLELLAKVQEELDRLWAGVGHRYDLSYDIETNTEWTVK